MFRLARGEEALAPHNNASGAQAQGRLRGAERGRQAFAGAAVERAPDVQDCERVHEPHVRSSRRLIPGWSPRAFPRLTRFPSSPTP
jgi:hypothetical protein